MNGAVASDALTPLIEKLEEPYRLLCTARYVHGVSAQEIGERYLLPVHVVQEDLGRARRRLLELALEKPDRA